MNKIKSLIIGAAILGTGTAKSQTMELKTKADTLSYAIGVSIAGNLQQSKLDKDLNVDILAAGMKDFYANKGLKMEAGACNSFIQNLMQERQAAADAEKQAKAGENLAKGKAYLEENKKRKGVVALPSGLQYEVITEGKGPKPGPSDKVKTHYHGTLMDGTVFDSSVQRGQPIEFPVNGVIKGWTEALQLMGTGSKWKLFIPADLAYGEQGAGGSIGPNETLIFEVELLEITK